MPSVQTAPTATAAQTSSTGSRILGYYLGAGSVKVDCLFDVANFITKAASGNFEAQTTAGKLSIAPAGSSSVRLLSSATMQYEVAAASSHQFVVNGTTIAAIGPTNVGFGVTTPGFKLHLQSSVEMARFETTVARGSGNGFIGIADPTGRKGYWGYGGPNDAMFLMNEMNNVMVFGTNGISRWAISAIGNLYPITDNSYSIGAAANRPNQIYAVSSTINTSDAREKTWRGGFSAAELAAARRIVGELGIYQWNDAIAEKGPDGARLHIGVQAQVAWDIMADEGLIDATSEAVVPDSRYAFLCYDEWPAIEAAEEVRDEDGNLISEAVEPREAGSRFGVRPDQLALFLIAAQEARLVALES